ncbi:MAG TPA: hypothetical protein VM889_01720 [Candidatus Thermoplasmatota archaeon]|nr:hypothetical protein [Candidatus Thermoplasmatota archaeon]
MTAPREHAEGAACKPRRFTGRSAVFAALFCAHCTLTGVAAFLAAGLAGAPLLFGVGLDWILPPFFILGAFGLWVWSGRRGEPAARAE